MTKNIYIYIIFSLILFAATSCSKTDLTKITLSGELKNVPQNKIVLTLEEDINRKKSQVVAEIKLDENGRFKFEKELTPHIYSLKVNDKKTVTLAIDTGQNIVVSGDGSDDKPIKVTGSEDTAKLEAYETFRKESLNRLVISVRNQIKELKERKTLENDPKLLELGKLEIENYNLHKDEMIEFVKKEMGTSIAVYPTSIRWDGDKNIAFLNDLAKQFEVKHPNLAITEKVKEKVRILTNNSIGGKVAEISLPDKDGKSISLSSIKAKVILIDFWGSWCGPCRRESGELTGLYKKYQSKGFEIYGVGLESENDAWLKAIEQDKRVWTNVVSLTEFETTAAFDFAVTSLPANFLIDANGMVVGKNLHGTDLRQKLETLMGNETELR